MLRDVLRELDKEIQDFILDSMSVPKDNIPELTRRFKNLRGIKDFIDDLQKVVDSTYEKFSKHIIPDAMENIHMDNARLHGKQFIVSYRLWASIPQEKQGIGFPWLRKNNWEMLIEEKVNAQKLSSAMTGVFREKNILPPADAVTTAIERHTSIKS